MILIVYIYIYLGKSWACKHWKINNFYLHCLALVSHFFAICFCICLSFMFCAVIFLIFGFAFYCYFGLGNANEMIKK